MDIEEIIASLQSLQLEQDQLLQQLATAVAAKETRAQGTVTDNTNKALKVGQQVEILTKGVRSQKGDIGTITKVTKDRVHLQVKRNGTSTSRKGSNVRSL